ncbi:MAG: GNAT family N-acetyltransferase [Spirochaetaceae bacterium]|nr:GNAT family N-acetyltransferase [Spirochaetaceae bacterium]
MLDQQLRLEKDETLFLAVRGQDSPDAARSGLAGMLLAKRAARPGADGAIPARGNISFVVVDEAARRRGIGSALMERAETWLRERGARTVRFGADSHHFFPGAPVDASPASAALEAFLAKHGYRSEGLEQDLAADLGALDLAGLERRAPLAPGYRIRRWEPALLEATVGFLRRNFPGRWLSDCLEAIDAGMRGEDLLLLEDAATRSIVGFSRVYDRRSAVLGPSVYWRGLMGDSPCGLGPIGVDAERRGLGLGLALLRASMAELARRGGRFMVIDWTDLGDFYGKFGFKPWREYRLYAKALSPNRG